jgi:hypothetical protein
MKVALVLSLALFGCKKDRSSEVTGESSTVTRTKAVDAAPPIDAAPTPTAPDPDKLDVCGKPASVEPLTAICRLGKAADQAIFECARPKPIMFCKTTVEWACFTNSMAGEAEPTVSFWAHHPSQGPMPKSGEIIDTDQMTREGPVLGIEIRIATSDAAGPAETQALVKRFTDWGCVAAEKYANRYTLDCGIWTAEVGYQDIIDKLIISAELRGMVECQ